MDKREEIPKDIIALAETVAKEATRDAMRDPLMPYYITVAPHIARAISQARSQAYEELIECAPEPLARYLAGKAGVGPDEPLYVGSETLAWHAWLDEAGEIIGVLDAIRQHSQKGGEK